MEMMMMSERKNNRGKIQIMGDVLALATSGIIVQDVSPDGVVYRTTTKGREFLLSYTRLVEFLEEEPVVELSAPYVSRQ
jgi:predicted transcriptional regulator